MDDTWVNDKPSMILRLPDERSETDNKSRLSRLSRLSSKDKRIYNVEFDPGSG